MFDNSRTVYTIVGNKKNIDLEELKKYGEVIFVKDNFFYKK